MKTRNIVVSLFLLGMLLSLMTLQGLTAQQRAGAQSKAKAKQEEKIYIPKEVKVVLQEGFAAREGRQDIPVSIFHYLYFPAQQNSHAVFFLRMKNSDLDFSPLSPSSEPTSAAEESTSDQETTEVQEAAQLQASFNVFLQFNLLEEGGEPRIVKEVYVPTSIQVETSLYNPDKEEMYSIGYPLPAGDYLLALAVTSLDLQKIGTAYFEFSLPDASLYTESLETNSIFFVKELEQLEAPEMKTTLHKGYCTYSILKIVPNIANVFSPGENLDVFFWIYGTQPNDEKTYDIEVSFMVKKGEEPAIRWGAQSYNSPLISQPLPLKQTVILTSEAGEREEVRDLEPGTYTLHINITDKISGKSVAKTVDFEVK